MTGGCEESKQCIIDQIVNGINEMGAQMGFSAIQSSSDTFRIESQSLPFSKCLQSDYEMDLPYGMGLPLTLGCDVNNMCSAQIGDETQPLWRGYGFHVISETLPTPTFTPTSTPTMKPVNPDAFHVLTSGQVVSFESISDASPDILDLSPWQNQDAIFSDITAYQDGRIGLSDSSTGHGFAFRDVFDSSPIVHDLPGMYGVSDLDDTDENTVIYLDPGMPKVAVLDVPGQWIHELYLTIGYPASPRDIAYLGEDRFAVLVEAGDIGANPTGRIDIFDIPVGQIYQVTPSLSLPLAFPASGCRMDASPDGSLFVLNPSANSLFAYGYPYDVTFTKVIPQA
ncbi:MAG TPA: hypothetical protein PKH07_20510, partial [bacterium]|nr:hypothetical protein [bacterium]